MRRPIKNRSIKALVAYFDILSLARWIIPLKEACVSFGVDTEVDLWQLKDKLKAAGFDVSEVIDHGFIHFIYSFDANGIPLEFSVNVPGRDVPKTPSIVDVNPSDVTLDGPEPRSDTWPSVKTPTPASMKKVYPGAGSELFHGKKKTE